MNREKEKEIIKGGDQSFVIKNNIKNTADNRHYIYNDTVVGNLSVYDVLTVANGFTQSIVGKLIDEDYDYSGYTGFTCNLLPDNTFFTHHVKVLLQSYSDPITMSLYKAAIIGTIQSNLLACENIIIPPYSYKLITLRNNPFNVMAEVKHPEGVNARLCIHTTGTIACLV